MDNIKEFTDFLKKMEEDVVKDFGIPNMESLTTSDGKEIDKHGMACIKMILAGCTVERMKQLQNEELFDRLATNFIKSNTKEDLEDLMRHTLAIKLANLIARNFR